LSFASVEKKKSGSDWLDCVGCGLWPLDNLRKFYTNAFAPKIEAQICCLMPNPIKFIYGHPILSEVPMKTAFYAAFLTLIASQSQAAQCPAPTVVAKAFHAGNQVFDLKGNLGDKDLPGMVVSSQAIGYMDKASVGLNNKYPENISSAWLPPPDSVLVPEWKFNVALKRGIFGDGEVTFNGATITYGGQVVCSYDFAEVSGLGVPDVSISRLGTACVPGRAKNWKLQIPATNPERSVAAQCAASKRAACALACIDL
jgi:hypothetical protein